MGQDEFSTGRYLRFCLAGGIAAAATHVPLVPIDVVKTRMQLQPGLYPSAGAATRTIIRTESPSALLLGFGPTLSGYLVQGFMKYGNYELFKHLLSRLAGDDAARYRLPIYIASSAVSELFADLTLAPHEAVRIRLVADPKFAPNMFSGLSRMMAEEGWRSWYKGLPPLWLKQIPYTAVQLTVFEKVLEWVYSSLPRPKNEYSKSSQLAVSLSAAAVAGVASGIVSHPADTVLSKINRGFKEAASHHEPAATVGKSSDGMWKATFDLLRQSYVKGETWLGLGPRLGMMTIMVSLQLVIYDSVKIMLGLGSSGQVSK